MSDRAIRNESLWRQYKRLVVTSFQGMSREQQESVIRTNCAAVSIGMAVFISNAIYALVPPWLRLLGVPLLVVGAYQSGKKLLAPAVIKRLERHLNTH